MEYSGLFLLSFLAATVLPLSSEVTLALVIQSRHVVLVPVLVATLGNYGGACTTYWIGRRTVQRVRKPTTRGAEPSRALKLLKQIGQPALLLSWVPLIGDAIVAGAGTLQVPFGIFSFWVIVGKALRYILVGWAAHMVLP